MNESFFRCRRAVPIASLALLAAMFFGCGRTNPVAAPSPTVRVVSVSRAERDPAARYSAVIGANAEVKLLFKTGGYVEQLAHRTLPDGMKRPVNAGDSVQAREVLASVRQADYDQRVGQAQAQVAQAQAAYEKARGDFTRGEKLFASQSITEVQLEALKSQHDASLAALNAAQAVLAQAKTAKEDSVLRAPFSGIVVRRAVDVGDLAGSTAPAFVIADTATLKAVFSVPDTVVGGLKIGGDVTLTTQSIPREFTARITAISPSAEPQGRVFPVEITVPNPDASLRPGMVVSVTLRPAGAAATKPALVVPLSALVRASRDPKGFAVFAVEGPDSRPVVRERAVTIGNARGNDVEVSAGLADGQRIVADGAAELRDGETVRVLP